MSIKILLLMILICIFYEINIETLIGAKLLSPNVGLLEQKSEGVCE